MTHHRHRDDSGQLVIAVTIGMVLLMLAGIFLVAFPLGAATDLRARTQTAADAAALAGAEGAAQTWVDLTSPGALRYGQLPDLPGSAGSLTAAEFATRNDAGLTAYRSNWRAGQIQVRVRSDDTLDGPTDRAQTTATAELGSNFTTTCAWSTITPTPTFPPPLPAPAPNAPPPPAPPAPRPPPPPPPSPVIDPTNPYRATLTCGSWSATYRLTYAPGPPPMWTTGTYHTGTTRDALLDDLVPRLIE